MTFAPYACQGDFHEDLDEIISSKPYRRLSGKSQVMVKPTRDHFRSRLIHTTEVNHIALAIGRRLELNIPLISAMAMAHDIGHTPFAHAGERTLQEILQRELSASFGVPLKKLPGRSVFHHASNSARMLLRKYERVQRPTVAGVLTHSWSPWTSGRSAAPTAETYEGQVVAIADQFASINHDTEDIIEGAAYTNYDFMRFSTEMRKWIQSKTKTANDVDKKIETFLKHPAPGYGRRSRLNFMIDLIVNGALAAVKGGNVKSSDQAQQHPIAIPDDWSAFLRYYEKFIREVVVKRESWFVGRDAIAEALVSTVFNHIWPSFKTGQPKQIPIWSKEEVTKSRVEEETRSIEHYEFFYAGDYGPNKLKDTLARPTAPDLELWDSFIVNQIPKKRLQDGADQLLRLISVIDFVAGLTDRYCLEIFDRVYKSFSI